MNDEHPDPSGEAAARVAQLAAMAVSVGEALARLRAQRTQDRAAINQQTAAAERAQQLAQAASARLVYTQALNETWARQASTSQLLTAWAATDPHLGADPLAGLAGDRMEERLRRLHPEAMRVYDLARAEGEGPVEARSRAADHWRGEYGLDPVGTRLGQPPPPYMDLARPPGRAWVVPEPAGHHSGAATSVAQVAAAQAYPLDIHQAMATAPQAAKALRALPPGPVRKQLTSTPTATAHLRSTP